MFDIHQKTSDYISLVVTHECNRICPFCIDKYRGKKEYITYPQVKKCLKFAKEKNIKDVLIVGGEPTLHPDIVLITQTVKDFDFRIIMTTNYSKPNIFKQLDGLVDCFNISFYNQDNLPFQKDIKSDLTISALIHAKQLETKKKLDDFIDKYSEHGHLRFSTLSICNKWTADNFFVPYLNQIDCEWVILFNEIMGQIYRDAIIKRHDLVVNNQASQLYKIHVNGEISKSWERTLF